jgi:hypothetical protein
MYVGDFMALPAIGAKSREQVVDLLDTMSLAYLEWLELGSLLDDLSEADGVAYDNTDSELEATTVQAAIDELTARVAALE